MAVDIDSLDTFVVAPWRLDARGSQLHLDYRLEAARRSVHTFTETFDFPFLLDGSDPATAAVLDLLALVGGVSYYKIALPDRVEIEGIEPTTAALHLLRGVYGPGLAEFRYTNGRPLDQELTLTATSKPPSSPAPRRELQRAVVPIGGGKDSAVTAELLAEAGVVTTLFTVGEHGPLARSAAVADRPRAVVRRHLAPEMLELNRNGGLNGHAPITAINSLLSLLVAIGTGSDAAVMSNEHSASFPTLVHEGTPVNHQWSKGVEHERLLRAALAASGADVPQYFSLLRPLTELAILQIFARYERYHRAFVSCNDNYAVGGDARATGWCANCPKCRFIYVGLATRLDRPAMVDIFGVDMLDDMNQLHGFRELLGLETRPFECIGTPEETTAAISIVAGRPEWAGSPVIDALIADLPDHAEVAAKFAITEFDDEHHVPDVLVPTLVAAVDATR